VRQVLFGYFVAPCDRGSWDFAMRQFLFLCMAMACVSSQASAQPKRFALPSHKGAMVLDLDGFKVTQQSAKPDGREIGVRAHDAGQMELLTFLFLTPENKSQTASSCLAQDIAEVRKSRGKAEEKPNPFGMDTSEWASVLLRYPGGYQTIYRYVGSGDQCLMVQVYADKGSKLDLTRAAAVLQRQRYQASYMPTLDDASAYEGIRGGAMLNKPVPKNAPKMLVGWYGMGGIPLPKGAEWKLDLLTAFDNAGRPSAQFTNTRTGVTVSFLISENPSGGRTAEACRKEILDGIAKHAGKLISSETVSRTPDGHGGMFATASHLSYLGENKHNHDVFAFAGNAKTCAEVHASVVSGKPDEEKALHDALAEFHPDLLYRAVWLDYYEEATAFYRQSPMMGAPFYDAALKMMPEGTNDAEVLKARRFATDNVVIALGMRGDITQARRYAEHGIKTDPGYPINYYNLACADAEEGKASEAKGSSAAGIRPQGQCDCGRNDA
jgi:hypothetical protein